MIARENRVALLAMMVFLSCGSADLPPEEGMRPELAGAQRVTGSMTDEDGNLPPLYIEYITVADEGTQRLTLYRNGLLTLTTEQMGRRTDKRILFPPEAIKEYEQYFSLDSLRRVRQPALQGSPTSIRETVRIYDDRGRYVERTLDPSMVLSGDLERQRVMLRDLVQLLFEDREISSPFHDYVPRVGDVLVDGEMSRWKVLRYLETEETLEVTDARELTRMYINVDQIDEMFIGFDRSGSDD